jgi:hypothetical protein
VNGDLLGDAGDDTFFLLGGSAANVRGGDDNDNITLGGSTVSGVISGDAGNDVITANAGSVGSIDAGNNEDVVRLFGGDINGGTLQMGAGNDRLEIDDSADPTASLDISGVTTFDGGSGNNDDATISNTNFTFPVGGFNNKQLVSWNDVTFNNADVDLDGIQTIDNLNLNSLINLTYLSQTDGALLIQNQAGGSGSTLNVNGGSRIFMNDGATDDSITVGNLNLAAGAEISTDVNPDASTSDVINVASGGVVTSVSTNIYLNVLGGTPTALAGSLAIVDNQTAGNDPATPNPGDILAPSGTYNLFNDPSNQARSFALVDETAGGGGVFLQWTTPLNSTTLGPNAIAHAAGAESVSGVIGAVADGIGSGAIGGSPVPNGHRSADSSCGSDGHRIWGQLLVGRNNLDPVSNTYGNFAGAGMDTDVAGMFGGTCGLNRVGIFGFYSTADTVIDDGFGSSAEANTYGGGGYARFSFGDFGLAAIGLAGKSDTDLVNGPLLGATSSIDTTSFGGQVTATYTPQLNDYTYFDIRAFGRGVWGDIDPYTDSFGLAFTNSDADTFRVGGTAGFIYNGLGMSDLSGSVYANAGAAYHESESTSSSNGVNVTHHFDEVLVIANAGLTVSPMKDFTLFANFSGEWCDHTESYTGRAGFSLGLN